MRRNPLFFLLCAVLCAAPAAAVEGPSAEDRAAFVRDTAKEFKLDAAAIEAALAQAQYQQSIINAITRPAEGKPWKDYRPIFMTADRINNGRAFYAEHRGELQRISAQTGVPAQYIVAIIGVETSYGRVTGNYRVLDALYTLGFFYPRREEFFRGELAQLFALSKEEGIDLSTLKGSYAGAIGQRRAFDLVGGGGRAPQEALGKPRRIAHPQSPRRTAM